MDIDTRPRTSGQRVVAATSGEHLGTVLLGLWMTAGLFLDGYFHQHLDSGGESFLTPWHAVFYAGFAAMVMWLVRMARARSPVAGWRLSSLPPGYAAAPLGVALFAVGAAGDAVWHSAFGVERGIDALLSPTHLLLFAGLLVLLTSPARAAVVPSPARPSSWMVAGSLASATALVAFFVNYSWGLGISALARVPYDPIGGVGETAVIAGVASTLVTTAVLFVAARVLLDVGHEPPVGAIAALFGGVALLVSAAFDEDAEGVAAALVAGVVLDGLLRVRGARALPAPATFAAAAAVLWLAYFGLVHVSQGVEWQPEIWLGAVVLNALVAAGIASWPGRSGGRAFRP